MWKGRTGGGAISEDTLHFAVVASGLVQTCFTVRRKQEKVPGVKGLSSTHRRTAQVTTQPGEAGEDCISALLHHNFRTLTVGPLGRCP